MESQIQLDIEPAFHPYLFIIFFATLFEYNLHRLITLIFHKTALKSDKHKWLQANIRPFYLLVVFSVLGFLVSIILAKKTVLLALMPIAAVTLFYTLPVFKLKEKLMRLREVPGLKIFLIAFVWASVTVLLPVIQSEGRFDVSHILLMILERSLFIFAITIPFDIRDMQADAEVGLKTFPVIIGDKKSWQLANFSCLAYMLVSFFHYFLLDQIAASLACLLSGLIILLCLNMSKLRQSPYYHYGILDGTIIIQSLLVILFHFI